MSDSIAGQGSPVSLQWHRRDTWTMIGLFIVSGIGYALLTCRELQWNDSAEIVLAARTSSILHPSGYPWYSVLASWVWSLPGIGGSFGVNGLSGIGAALCIFPLYATARRWTASRALAIAMTIVSLFSMEMLTYGTLAEVYTWHVAIQSTIFYGLVRWFTSSSSERKTKTERGLLLVLVAGGFGFGMAHHLTTSWWVPAFLVLGLVFRRHWPSDARFLGLACLAVGVGLSCYVFLPWRSMQQPFFDYGATGAGFENTVLHVMGRMFSYRLGFIGWDGVLRNGANYLDSLVGNWPWPFLLAFPLGLLQVRIVRKEILVALGIWWVCGLLFCLFYTVPDPQGYYIALHLPFGGVSLVGWWTVIGRFSFRWNKKTGWLEWLVCGVCVLLVLPQTLGADRSNDRSLGDLTRLVWQDAPKGTLLITQDLSLLFSTVSMQMDEELPEENRVVAEFLLPLPWYREHLRKRYPDVKIPENLEGDVGRREKELKKLGGRHYGDAMQRVAAEMAQSVAGFNLDEREVRLYRADNSRIPERWGEYYLLDGGLTARVSRTREVSPLWKCDVPDRYREPENWSSGETTVGSRLATSCNRLGIRLYENGRNPEALATIRQAVRIDPRYAAAYKNLGVLLLNRFQDEKGAREAWNRYRELAGSQTDAAIRKWLENSKEPKP